MCFVWIWEQTAIISLYNINWLVCITETERVYCAVRTEHLTFSNSTFCPHSVFMCFVWIWEQTAIISLYSINWLVCVTETECVYCAVRTQSWNILHFNLSLKELNVLWSYNSKTSWRRLLSKCLLKLLLPNKPDSVNAFFLCFETTAKLRQDINLSYYLVNELFWNT